MSERHSHKFVPIGGFEQRGTERMQQFCECGAQRCVGEAAHGFGSSSRRCTLAAVPGERHCKRHKERSRGPDWVEVPSRCHKPLGHSEHIAVYCGHELGHTDKCAPYFGKLPR